MTDPTLLDHVLIGVLAVFMLLVVTRGQRSMRTTEFDAAARISMYWANGAVLWIGAIIVGAVWMKGDRSPAALGLTVHQAEIGTGLLLAAAFLVGFAVDEWSQIRTSAGRAKVIARQQLDTPFLPRSTRELGHWTVVSVTAGITEEVIFRGYLISYVSGLTGTSTAGLVAAAAIPALLFGLAHVYQGRASIIRIVIVAGLWGAIFVVTRSLLIPIILHTLTDLWGGYLAMRLRGGEEEEDRVVGE